MKGSGRVVSGRSIIVGEGSTATLELQGSASVVAKDNNGYRSLSYRQAMADGETSTVNLNVSSMSVRDETDIRSLAVEIASLTKRQQNGRGVRVSLG